MKNCIAHRRRFLSMVLLAFGAASGLGSAAASPGGSSAEATQAPEPLARVAIQFARNQVRVPVSVLGSAPFLLILDTGMPTRGLLLRHSDRVDSLKLEFGDGGPLSGGGNERGAVASRVATAARIEVGGLGIPDVPIIVLPAGAGLPVETDGVIGSELFEKFAVRVDVDELRLDLFPADGFNPPAEATVLPLRFREGSAFVDARVAVGSGQLVDADLAVDLGAGHSLWLNEGSESRFAPPASAISTTFGHGLSGPVTGRVARVRRVELGSIAFENVVTVFPVEEHQNPGGFDFRDGFVGADLLTRFDVTFDYPGKRMVLEKGGRFAEPFEFDMTGMSLQPGGADRRRVNSVLEGSPAENAGVVAGDHIIAVNGQPLSALSSDELMRAFRRDGAEIVIRLERGTTTMEKRLRLRRLV